MLPPNLHKTNITFQLCTAPLRLAHYRVTHALLDTATIAVLHDGSWLLDTARVTVLHERSWLTRYCHSSSIT